ncbi:hypothetical protein PV328_007077 [Microctonus aethiopoides]|uniref:Uncharacterized protein n=1 Tax=Microctonus aethiopoides TaxID=144406 RepID=A0AA39FQG5_9HYME|nr:hypothetical protein PV328_007077 [Microctonus aethiopoides]
MRVVSTREYKLIPGYIGEAGDRINNQSLVPKCKLRGIRASQVEWSVLLCDAPVFGYASVMHEEPYPIIIQTSVLFFQSITILNGYMKIENPIIPIDAVHRCPPLSPVFIGRTTARKRGECERESERETRSVDALPKACRHRVGMRSGQGVDLPY